eukprot:m.15460 g.15460  ORF g.15460 m.15460 type:complete len:523 (+) comp7854_c0_seq2:269-1837(+)
MSVSLHGLYQMMCQPEDIQEKYIAATWAGNVDLIRELEHQPAPENDALSHWSKLREERAVIQLGSLKIDLTSDTRTLQLVKHDLESQRRGHTAVAFFSNRACENLSKPGAISASGIVAMTHHEDLKSNIDDMHISIFETQRDLSINDNSTFCTRVYRGLRNAISNLSGGQLSTDMGFTLLYLCPESRSTIRLDELVPNKSAPLGGRLTWADALFDTFRGSFAQLGLEHSTDGLLTSTSQRLLLLFSRNISVHKFCLTNLERLCGPSRFYGCFVERGVSFDSDSSQMDSDALRSYVTQRVQSLFGHGDVAEIVQQVTEACASWQPRSCNVADAAGAVILECFCSPLLINALQLPSGCKTLQAFGQGLVQSNLVEGDNILPLMRKALKVFRRYHNDFHSESVLRFMAAGLRWVLELDLWFLRIYEQQKVDPMCQFLTTPLSSLEWSPEGVLSILSTLVCHASIHMQMDNDFTRQPWFADLRKFCLTVHSVDARGRNSEILVYNKVMRISQYERCRLRVVFGSKR